MKKETFIGSAILTVMDITVFCLCVDKGLTPVAIVGACYIALRYFSRDAQNAVNLINPAIDIAVDWLKKTKKKFDERKEEIPEDSEE